MKINDALRGVQLLGIETAPFIYYVEQNPSYFARMFEVFKLVNAGVPQVVTSLISLTEVLVRPMQAQNRQLEQAYRSLILYSRFCQALPVTEPIATIAAELRAKYNLRTPDALQVATAIQAQCDAFLTNDRTMKRVTEVQVLVLDELT